MPSEVKIVDSHNKVFQHWAELRNGLAAAPRLITLDHHTDTSRAFRRKIRQIVAEENLQITASLFEDHQQVFLKAVDFTDMSTVLEAQKNLNNDEHIVAAIQTDIISSACVIAHNAQDTDLATYLQHKIICASVPDIPHDSEVSKPKPDCDIVLESGFLESCIHKFNLVLQEARETLLLDSPYIFDIDLDYLNTLKSVEPNCDLYLKELVTGASLVTIATEPEYVKACAVDEGLTSEWLLEKFIKQFV